MKGSDLVAALLKEGFLIRRRAKSIVWLARGDDALMLDEATTLPEDVAERIQRSLGRQKSADAPAEAALLLVVDDYADARELYASCLAESGYRVEQAANGQEALDSIERSRPAAVLMDLSMPVLDGWEATKRIKSDPKTADIFVIAVTGHCTQQSLRAATEAGADAIMAKPCVPADLVARVRGLLGEDRKE